MVRPDGKIALNLLGEADVAGRTPDEIGRTLTAVAERFYNNPEIRVEVSKYNSRVFYVHGVPDAQARRPFTGGETVWSVLAQLKLAGNTRPKRVCIQRLLDATTWEFAVMEVDVERLFRDRDVRQNFRLQENDILVIDRAPPGRMVYEILSSPLGFSGWLGRAVPGTRRASASPSAGTGGRGPWGSRI